MRDARGWARRCPTRQRCPRSSPYGPRDSRRSDGSSGHSKDRLLAVAQSPGPWCRYGPSHPCPPLRKRRSRSVRQSTDPARRAAPRLRQGTCRPARRTPRPGSGRCSAGICACVPQASRAASPGSGAVPAALPRLHRSASVAAPAATVPGHGPLPSGPPMRTTHVLQRRPVQLFLTRCPWRVDKTGAMLSYMKQLSYMNGEPPTARKAGNEWPRLLSPISRNLSVRSKC